MDKIFTNYYYITRYVMNPLIIRDRKILENKILECHEYIMKHFNRKICATINIGFVQTCNVELYGQFGSRQVTCVSAVMPILTKHFLMCSCKNAYKVKSGSLS